MERLICDTYYSDPASKECSSKARFRLGITIRMIETYGSDSVKTISETYGYSVNRLTCCSSVKETIRDWHYIIPNNCIPLLSKWILELQPIFPTLDIGLYETNNPSVRENGAVIVNTEFAEYGDLSGTTRIAVRLKLGIQSEVNYGYTNTAHSTHGYFTRMSFMMRAFLQYCAHQKIELNRDTVKDLALRYIKEEETTIRTLLSDLHIVLVQLNNPAYAKLTKERGPYSVETSRIIDIENTELDGIVPYLESVYKVNSSLCDGLVEYYTKDRKHKENTMLRVRYSQKRYPVEAYLAHILLRAALGEDSRDFVLQYFKIKKQFPDMYFWNLIFLTQMGFNFYYYYWLTDKRFFKVTNEEDFLAKAKAYQGHSAQEFFSQAFVRPVTLAIARKLLAYYKSGELRAVVNSLSEPIKVRPTELFRHLNDNFLISDDYDVAMYDDTSYFVLGDDYRIRKYKKENFELVAV